MVYRCFTTFEELLAKGAEPIAPFASLLSECAGALRAMSASGLANMGDLSDLSETAAATDDELRELTGRHYGRLFAAFSPSSYFEEPANLLRDRLERNGVDVADLQGKSVIDLGCGGGRYSVAWKLLGAGSVVGVDGSELGIADAQRRVADANIGDVSFEVCDVLDVKHPDASFDVSFSNGVLHHSTDWERGVREMVRVLKPGGLGWLYLIENPGGLFWDFIEILRVVMSQDSSAAARVTLSSIGVPSNRVFYVLDHVMAPINLRLTADQIVECLDKAGATQIRRLERGADFDRVEAIHNNAPYAVEYFGAGENRFVFSV